MAKKTKTRAWDSAEHLETNEDIAAYLDAVLAENDPALLTHALGVVARARGMTELARETGLGRASLYKALSAEGHPEFATVMKVMDALGVRMSVTA
ncbi:MAG: putative addiction module antidote protein [Rhodobiaceae bacterium]|nr:putative addiction module antidote protein [Rhodobiaceae bacterium]|tara:strand:- start:329 stop:616 length:288 start_codon:yes stop_codon:yes gene_type:complete